MVDPGSAGPSPSTTAPPRQALVLLSIALLCVIWGSTWIVIQWGLRDLPPFQSAAARFLVAAVVMSAVARALVRREGGRRPPLWLSATVGVTNFGISYGIVYWTETRLPSGITSVLWAIFPILMAASGHWFLPGEKLRPTQVAGFVIGFSGVVVLFLTDIRRFGGDVAFAAAILLFSPVVSSIGTTVLKRYGATTSSILVNRDAMWIGAALLALAALAFERQAPARWTPEAIAGIGYLAIAGTAVTFGLYFWLLRHTAAHKLSLISYVTPAIALVLGKTLGSEAISKDTLAGSALILAGVAIVVRARKRNADRSDRYAAARDSDAGGAAGSQAERS